MSNVFLAVNMPAFMGTVVQLAVKGHIMLSIELINTVHKVDGEGCQQKQQDFHSMQQHMQYRTDCKFKVQMNCHFCNDSTV